MEHIKVTVLSKYDLHPHRLLKRYIHIIYTVILVVHVIIIQTVALLDINAEVHVRNYKCKATFKLIPATDN